ncbi:MAG: thiamine phosphate synthase [Candidatus Sedimenticola sp. (ex Thyasira tokunagai)]
MINRPNLKGLYAITDDELAAGRITAQVAEALAGGVAVIQYRSKKLNPEQRLDEVRQLLPLCRRASVPLIINDDIELALESGADGVHLGRNDEGIEKARERLGADAIIGISCYNQFDAAEGAQIAGADYVAFGRFFPSNTKPGAIQADPALLRRASRELQIPTVAIGGITPENGVQLITAGADMLAVVHGIFGQRDIKQACRHFQQLFQPSENPSS